MFHKLHVLGMNDDLWDKVRGLGSETWKGCERVEPIMKSCSKISLLMMIMMTE